ncbi:RNA polymerase sigma factor sigE, chloroplastic/mitochondrial isoform X2 [Physcomitrium patens]|uniref:Uncharacterized protein n=1 Tax=Physcomitrium patens TaxID=3218 RepID=A0A7I4C9U0_PHYPA|nr:RNA polymerase sigma factor sigE, chloroplastic/mitochondrial-like isoform X2 [Physcomitrium patens]|eukprot:XP_024360985.1 RNA polymerase sigma factor sigE, chloroplastic/mitochondrial-like isoform X2 [Physcomitrella patens]
MESVCLRPQALSDSSQLASSRYLSLDTFFSQVYSPTSIHSRKVPCFRRLRSGVPASSFRHGRHLYPIVATAISSDSSQGNELKKTSRRRVKGRARVALVEAVEPDVSAEGLLQDSLSARLEHAYRIPSLEILKSDLEARFDSVSKEEELESDDGSIADGSVEEQSTPEADSVRKSVRNGRSKVGVNTDSNVEGGVKSSSVKSPKAVKKRSSRRQNVEGNRILKITKNSVTRQPRKVAVRTPSHLTETGHQVAEDQQVAADRGGKRRLSLRSRIAMKQNKLEASVVEKPGPTVDSWNMDPEDQLLWSQEAEELINKYTTSMDLAAPLWDKLDRGLLTAVEENRLAVFMKPMKRNLRLVLSQAYKYHKDSMSLSIQDLCQEGVIGLMQAVDKFDPGKGYRFSTYGIYWIRNSILRAQTKSGHMLRSPHNVSTHRVNIQRAKVELFSELGRQPTNDEIRKHLGITADRFRDILRTNMRTSSLHEHDRITGREKVENLVSEEDALDTLAGGTSMVQYGLDDVLDSLRPKENLVLRQRFGLDGKGQRSLSEVGLILNLSREMVRRYELRGILKLQHPTRVEYLRNYLN